MSTSASGVPFLKGHGTGNDFVLLPDPEDRLRLTDDQVAALCDRHFGIGADGVLRAVPSRSADVPDWMTGDSRWFMDYRNADGSVAEMCGNGARVFAAYLAGAGLVSGETFTIGTRGGARRAAVPMHGRVGVTMGRAARVGPGDLTVTLGDATWPAIGVHVPNPHAVAFVQELDALGPLDDRRVTPMDPFPDGVNVEFVEVVAEDVIRLRVHERGVGETLSCGTGACAAAWAHRLVHKVGRTAITVHVAGGEVLVDEEVDGELTLTGPAVLLASGVIDPEWLAAA